MDYDNISKAVNFYKSRGYVYTEDAPWLVDRDAYYATRPIGAVDMMMSIGGPGDNNLTGKFPVASGEQSFIQMILDGRPLKRAICVTPCFRYEPKHDMLHKQYFMKAELINAQDVDEGHLVHMVHDACSFFEQFFSVRVIATGREQYDIVEKGTRIELGSYGIRYMAHPDKKTKDLSWIYGTACAEPRLSTAIAKHSHLVGK